MQMWPGGVRLVCKKKKKKTTWDQHICSCSHLKQLILVFEVTRWSDVTAGSSLSSVLVLLRLRREERTKRSSAGTSSLVFFFPISRSGQASFPEDVVKFVEDELHRLVLVNHVDRHVPVVPFRTHERRSEHDADVLRGHAVSV